MTKKEFQNALKTLELKRVDLAKKALREFSRAKELYFRARQVSDLTGLSFEVKDFVGVGVYIKDSVDYAQSQFEAASIERLKKVIARCRNLQKHYQEATEQLIQEGVRM